MYWLFLTIAQKDLRYFLGRYFYVPNIDELILIGSHALSDFFFFFENVLIFQLIWTWNKFKMNWGWMFHVDILTLVNVFMFSEAMHILAIFAYWTALSVLNFWTITSHLFKLWYPHSRSFRYRINFNIL